MKPIFLAFPSTLFACLLLPAFAQEGDPTLATVDGTPILQSEIDESLRRAGIEERLNGFPPEQSVAMLRQLTQNVVNERIGEILMLNAAKEDGIEVSDEEVEARMTEVVANLVPGGDIENFLAQAGIDRASFERDVRENLVLNRLIASKTDDIAAPTAEEISAFYAQNQEQMRQPESVRARHILIKTQGLAPEELPAKKTTAEAVRQRLLSDPSLDFAEVAKDSSEGPSAPRGGDLGEFQRGQMVPEFEQAAFTQEVGAIGELVQTEFGYHIIKVESRQEGRVLALEEVQNQIRDHLQRERQSARMRSLIDEWRSEAEIVTPAEDA